MFEVENYMNPFKLALIQMKVEGGNRERNLKHAEKMISEAADNLAKVVLLPEALNLGWTHPSALLEAEQIPEGETAQFLINQSKEKGIYICCGLIEKDGEKVFNSAVIIDPNGELLLKHRKINELEIGLEYYSTGDNTNVCETEFGTLGLAICADAFVSSNLKSLGQLGADIILSPCSWATPKEHNNLEEPYGGEWEKSYSPIAKEYSLWIAGCSNVGWITDGPWKNRKCIGNSLVVNSKGNVAATGPYGVDAETILYIDINNAN